MKDFIFLIHAGATLFLVGLIWTIQIVHYPLFANVGADNYAVYQNLHMLRITFVVAPVMIAELIAAIYFIFTDYAPVNPNYFRVGLILVLVIWVSTMFVQSPIHGKLAQAFDGGLVSQLVMTNWLRTICWTLRGVLVLWIIWLKLK